MSGYLPKATRIAEKIPQVLANRGLEPIIRAWKLFDDPQKGTWLFAVLDERQIPRIERYTNREVIHQLSTALDGIPVVISNTTGLRYAFRLSPRPQLPKDVAFPGARRGLLQIGAALQDEVSTTPQEFGNGLIAGITRSGKSNLIRLLAAQILATGHQAIIIDPQGDTFPEPIRSHPGVMAQAHTLSEAPKALGMAAEIHFQRQAARQAARAQGYPDPEEPHLFVIMDEFTGLMLNHGGRRGEFAAQVYDLAYGALKYRIHLILGGHEFTKEDVGPIAGQMATRFCFQVGRASIGQVVVGRRDLAEVKTTGRAFAILGHQREWVQVYRMDDSDITQALGEAHGDGLSPQERRLWQFVKNQNDGLLTVKAIMETCGVGRPTAEKTQATWVERGLARRDPQRNNSFVLVEREEVRGQ